MNCKTCGKPKSEHIELFKGTVGSTFICGIYDDGTEVLDVGIGDKSLPDPSSQSQEETEFWRKYD